ncbi:MAG TPA: hydantoinase B/oxoprolinase family protein, partial [Candidatus Limnocylindrales bacterium]
MDQITVAVVESALIAMSDEMSEALHRSAYSPIIREMLDYSCAVFDAAGHTVAQAENIPALLGSMGIALGHLVAENPTASLRDGDIYIANDPYKGGTHTPDIHIFMPVFHAGQLIGWTGSLAHHADIGGTNPGTEGFANRSIFEEGLRFPNIRLFEAGVPCEPLHRYIEANIREPAATLGDLRAQVAAVKLGAVRLRELAGRYGHDDLETAMAEILDQAERRVRSKIAARRDGTATAIGWLDNDGIGEDPVRIEAAVTVA